MQVTHPSAEQLSLYMESPESNEHRDIRQHLMHCEDCRNRVDHLTQLELDIKHYAPRFTSQLELRDDNDFLIERFVDGQLAQSQRAKTEQRIHSDPGALKTALHYAVHAAAMRENIDTMSATMSVNVESMTGESGRLGTTTGLLQRILASLQWSTPAWTIAPASLVLAAIISYTFFTTIGNSVFQDQPRIVAFQDQAVLKFQQTTMPSGSIGFFHDAQTHSEPFSGMHIQLDRKNSLNFSWPAVSNAADYTLALYDNQHGDLALVAQQTANQTNVQLQNLTLTRHGHYTWKLSGRTHQGVRFQSQGDFIYLGNSN